MTEAELFCTLAKGQLALQLAAYWPQIQKNVNSAQLTKITFGDSSVVYVNARGDAQDLQSMALAQATDTLWPVIWKWLLATPTEQWPVEFRDALALGPSFDPVGAEVLAGFLK